MLNLNKQDLLQEKSRNYRPTTLIVPAWYNLGLLQFSLTDVEIIRRDYQVALGLYFIKAPLFTLEWTIKSKNAEVVKYLDKTMKDFWKPNILKVLKACEYGYSGGECIFKLKEDGLIYFETLKEFHPRDLRVLTVNNNYVGMRVKHITNAEDCDLAAPKAFFFAMDREFGSYYGRSLLLNIWDSWFEKRSKDGAIDIRRLWFYKNAYSGGIIRHPIKDYVMPDGSVYPAREMAREQAERMKTGAVIAFPNVKDESGNYQWTYETPHINGNATEIREYPKDLDNEILRGLGIPDTVVTDPNGGGSYAGRRVPERAFYVRLEMIVAQIMTNLKNQLLINLVKMNFEGENDFEIITKPLVEIMSPEGTPPAGSELGGDLGTTVGGVFDSAIQEAQDGLGTGSVLAQ